MATPAAPAWSAWAPEIEGASLTLVVDRVAVAGCAC